MQKRVQQQLRSTQAKQVIAHELEISRVAHQLGFERVGQPHAERELVQRPPRHELRLSMHAALQMEVEQAHAFLKCAPS